MKVVIDTSTFIRSTLERDQVARKCMKIVMTTYQTISTDRMAEELLTAIYGASKRKGKNPLSALEIAGRLLLRSEKIETTTKFPWCYDPTDFMFIECAIDGGAKVVVSNDRSLTTTMQ
jgi:putative PIN family toxin of toxin-antitoxin system